MKKNAFFLSALVITASCGANDKDRNGGNQSEIAAAGMSQGQQNPMTPSMGMPPAGPNCTALTPNEQVFAGQIMEMDNKMMFCSQFTPQQRQMAMQMVGKPDAAGNKMSADGAVQQVMQTNGMMAPAASPKGRPSGGSCPVK